MKTVIDAIAPYDRIEQKGYSYHEIISSLNLIDEVGQQMPEFKYEMIAFGFVPGHSDNEWGTYYAPQSTFVDIDGNLIYLPDIKDITEDTIKYWEERYEQAKNPLLVSHYAGLVWDFKPKIIHKPYKPNLYRIYVDSMLQVCNEDYCSPVIIVQILERLFSITKGQKEELEKTKCSYRSFEERHSSDTYVRLWSSQFLLMIENRKCFNNDEIQNLLMKHEERLSRVTSKESINPWIVKDQVEVLCRYYNSINSKNDVKRLLQVAEDAFEKTTIKLNRLSLIGNLEDIYHKYYAYGLKDASNRLLLKIQQLGELPMESPQLNINVSDAISEETKESQTWLWENFAKKFIPDIEYEKRCLEEQVKRNPLKYHVPTQLNNQYNLPISLIGSYDSDYDGQLVLHLTENIYNSDAVLASAISQLISAEILHIEKFINNFVNPCLLFENDRRDIIKDAIEYFIDKKYNLFSHLIIPQIEHAIRNLIKIKSGAIHKYQNDSKGFKLRILDDLLRDDIVAQVFGNDCALYFRLVLTDRRSLNIRNLLCHGLVSPDNITSFEANRLFHIVTVICLAKVADE